MHLSRFIALFALAVPLTSQFATREKPQLWYLHHSDTSNDKGVETSKALMDRAAAAGYTGLILWDGAFDSLDDPNGSVEDADRLKVVIKHAASKHLKILATAAPFSFALHTDWAEASRVIGSQFKVNRAQRRLDFLNSFRGLENGDFEAGRSGWFDMGDEGTEVDSEVVHNGRYAAVVRDAKANARFRQKLTLKPWRQYHLTFWYRSRNFHGYSQVEILSKTGPLAVFSTPSTLFQTSLSVDGSRYWTQGDFVFNSRETTEAYLYFGVWGGCSGIIWFDDVQIEETALVYLLRCQRAPLRIYDPAHPEVALNERAQLREVVDPRMLEAHPFHDSFHGPPTVTLPPWTHLPDGFVIAMDYYAVFPIPRVNTVAMCLTDRAVLSWLKDDAHAIRKILPSGAGIMMQYDEIRQMNSCAECRAKHLSAGELLAWSVGQAVRVFQASFPEGLLYTWSDMFDPYHNAVKDYYYVEGDLAGSWKGVPRAVTIMNWNLDNLRTSLIWFSGSDPQQPIPHDQIIAAYYDRHEGVALVPQQLEQAKGIPGIRGMMYSTWVDDYSQLENFAAAVRANWATYAGSVSR